MIVLLYILAMLLLFSFSIFVHELGHFIAARSFGMIADVFSIGMGKALWKKKMFGTTVQLGCLPFGGYVALPQMDPNSFLEGEAKPARDLPKVAPWKKIIVSVAGAAGNLLFALLLATVVWIVGKPATLEEQNSIVGFVAKDCPARELGLTVGDEILAVNGDPVENWQDILNRVALSNPHEPVVLTIRTPDGSDMDLVLEAEKTEMGIWMLPGIMGMNPCYVASVEPDSPAQLAGLRAGDELIRYDGVKLYSRGHLTQLVEAAEGASRQLDYRRDGQPVSVEITAAYNENLERWLMGITFNTLSDLDFNTRVHPSPWSQIRQHSTAIFDFLRALVTPSTSGAAAGAVGGPLMILVMLWLMLKSSFVLAIWFTGFLNVNLAIINLLPLPILDGGHVVMNLWEWVTGKPPPARLVNALANVFAVLILAVFLLLVYRDSVRSVWPLIRDNVSRNPAPMEIPAAE